MRNHVNAIANVNVQVGNQAIVRVIRNLQTRCSMKRCAMSGRDSRSVDLGAPRFLRAARVLAAAHALATACPYGWRFAYPTSHSHAPLSLAMRAATSKASGCEAGAAFAAARSRSCGARQAGPRQAGPRQAGHQRLASPASDVLHGVLGEAGCCEAGCCEAGFCESGKRFG